MQSNTMTRTGLIYLFISVALSLLLHREFLPIWVIVLAPVIMLWRYFIFNGKLKKPSGVIKLALVVAGFYGVYFTYGIALSIESAVTLLVASLSLKPLEVQGKRDSYVLLFLSILVQGQHFLFEQGPLAYLFVLLCLFSTVTALVVVNQSTHRVSPINISVKIFLLSIPLTVFLFFILPRIGPLWSVNLSTQAGIVGLSDSMSPGDVSELGKSDELAFRVSFESKAPPINQRYWRAIVLDNYDGENWRSKYVPKVNWQSADSNVAKDLSTPVYKYEVTSEAHEKKWLFALDGSTPRQKGIGLKDDGLLINSFKAMRKFQYSAQAPMLMNSAVSGLDNVQASLSTRPKTELSWLQQRAYLQLPSDLNPKTVELAQSLLEQSSDDLSFVRLLADYYLKNAFSYTLSPGLANTDNRVDAFLFDNKIGFCAHYAGSAVYLLRSAGIPSRVVLGYLGGEINPVGEYYSVYQYDAHAWVEVWIESVGWIRIDPTGWVSPERVEAGVEQAVASEFVGFKTQFKWLNDVRHQIQAFNFLWNDLMLGYKDGTQQAVLDSVFGSRDSLTWGVMISGVLLVIMGAVFFVVILDSGRSSRSEHGRLLDNYVRRLNKVGIAVTPSMSFIEIERAVKTLYPQTAYSVSKMTALLNQILYQTSSSQLTRQVNKEYKKLMVKIVMRCR